MTDQWTKEWLAHPSANWTKCFYSRPDLRKAKFVYKLARLELGRFARIITGHNNLNDFQARIGYVPSATCRLCEDGPESFLHLLKECPSLWELRREIFLDDLPTDNMRWSVRKLLEFSFHSKINDLLEGTWIQNDGTTDHNMDPHFPESSSTSPSEDSPEDHP